MQRFSKGVSPCFWSKIVNFGHFQFSSKIVRKKCFLTLYLEIQPFKAQKTSTLKVENVAIFLRGQSMILGQILESFFFFFLIVGQKFERCVLFFQLKVQNKVFCDGLARKLSILSQKNVKNLAFFQRGQSTVFDKKLEILSFLFFSKIVQNKVFCDIVDRNLAI